MLFVTLNQHMISALFVWTMAALVASGCARCSFEQQMDSVLRGQQSSSKIPLRTRIMLDFIYGIKLIAIMAIYAKACQLTIAGVIS